MECRKCKAEFVPTRKGHIYCSRSCKKRWYDGTPKGKATIFRYHMKPEVRERRRYKKVVPTEKNCIGCGVKFIGKKSTRVYCSERCYQHVWYRRRKAVCQVQ